MWRSGPRARAARKRGRAERVERHDQAVSQSYSSRDETIAVLVNVDAESEPVQLLLQRARRVSVPRVGCRAAFVGYVVRCDHVHTVHSESLDVNK